MELRAKPWQMRLLMKVTKKLNIRDRFGRLSRSDTVWQAVQRIADYLGIKY